MHKNDLIDTMKLHMQPMSESQLRRLIINLLRCIPRDAYDDVLSILNKADAEPEIVYPEDLLEAIALLSDEIENEEYGFTQGRPNYSDYGDWSDEYDLIDEDGLCPKLETLFNTAIACVQAKNYALACEAFERLLDIEFPAYNEGDVTMEMLFEQGLIDLDFESTLHTYAHAAMMHSGDAHRELRLLDIVSKLYYKFDINAFASTLDEEIPDRQAFAQRWLALMMEQDFHTFRHGIVVDAALFCGGTQALDAFVLEHGQLYRHAYVVLIRRYIDAGNYERATQICEHGLAAIGGIDTSRTHIGELLIEIGEKTKDEQRIQQGTLEAFYSSADIEHYAMLHSIYDESIIEQAIRYLDGLHQPDSVNFAVIHFLHGDYEMVWRICSEDKEPLGWSSSKKGKLIPLFIALLAGDTPLKPCTKQFIESSYSDMSCLKRLINMLRATFVPISDEQFARYYGWCVSEIEGRAGAILGRQLRGSYDKVAKAVVAMAEVLLARNEPDEALGYIASYKRKFPRHVAFHACLLQAMGVAHLRQKL